MTRQTWQGRAPSKSGLALRLLFILTIAILPLGLISVYQTAQVIEESRELSEAALLDRTQKAAGREQQLVQSAFGAADAVAAAIPVFRDDQATCDSVMARLVAADDNFSFAGFINAEGQITCSSTGIRLDVSGTQVFRDLMSDPVRRFNARPDEALPMKSAMGVTVPVIVSGTPVGFVTVAIPQDISQALLEDHGEPVDLVVFDRNGEVLSMNGDGAARQDVLPRNRELASLAREGRQAFRSTNRRGGLRDFAVVPIVGDEVFLLGSWTPDNRQAWLGMGEAMALYFPLLMWVTGMIVAYFGLNRLVIRHIRRLRHWMRLYATGEHDLSDAQLHNAPEEIEVVAEAFRNMTRRLSEHERHREEDLQEKATLLREVHHRVKNNLQLISSLMNMQIRNAKSEDVRLVLGRVQERVLALAAIHRQLYMARNVGKVRADLLLRKIIEQLMLIREHDAEGNAINASTNFDVVEIAPDQSVPLALLATEALTNAAKYCAAPPDAPPWLTVALTAREDGTIHFSVVNSRRPTDADAEEHERVGLGTRLIESFVAQLGGTSEVEDRPDRFGLHVTFELQDPSEDDAEA